MTIPPQPADQEGTADRDQVHQAQVARIVQQCEQIADLRARLTEIGGDPDGLATYIGKYQEQAKAAIERAEKVEAKLAEAERERESMRANAESAWKAQDKALTERDALRAEVERLRTELIQVRDWLHNRDMQKPMSVWDNLVAGNVKEATDSIEEISESIDHAIAATGGGVAGNAGNAGQGETNHGG